MTLSDLFQINTGLNPLDFIDDETYKSTSEKMHFVTELVNRVSNEYGVDVEWDRVYIDPDHDDTDPDWFNRCTIDEYLESRTWKVYIPHPYENGNVWEYSAKDIMDCFNELNKTLRTIETISQHVVDSHNGIYSAQIFVNRFESYLEKSNKELDGWEDLKDDINIVLKGPDEEFYYESWDRILNNAIVIDNDGVEHTIHENEGIFLVRSDMSEVETELYFS